MSGDATSGGIFLDARGACIGCFVVPLGISFLFKWLPPGSTETAVAFRTFHKFLIASSSHSNNDPSTTRNMLDSAIFCTLQVLKSVSILEVAF